MNYNLEKFLNFLEFDKDEIDELIKVCPGLKIKNNETVIKCVTTLTAYGFPRSELKNLILLNPHFLLGNPEHINRVLNSINGDIVKILFENPHII